MIIACTQDHVLPDECPECSGWLHTEFVGGFPGPVGFYCSEQCAINAQTWHEQATRDNHVHVRDLLCDCPVCTQAGHPTPEERAEWDNYHHGEATT